MLPDAQGAAPAAAGDLVALDDDGVLDVPLYWQQWRLDSPLLQTVASAVIAGAREALL